MSEDLVMPRTVGEMRGYAAEIRCKRCGRRAPIEPAQMTTAGGRAIDRHLPLPKFLAKLTCAAKACGERPAQLHVSAKVPPAPGDRAERFHRWVMDRRGLWTFLGASDDTDNGS